MFTPQKRQLIIAVIVSFVVPLSSSWAAWPETRDYIEQALPDGTSIFIGTLVCDEVHLRNENVLDASARLIPQRLIYGTLPTHPINLGLHKFLVHGGSGGDTWPFWLGFDLAKGTRTFDLLTVCKQDNGDWHILYVYIDKQNDSDRLSKEVLEIQAFERTHYSNDLRKRLTDAAVAAKNSELLWQYAFRKLLSFEKMPSESFDLVLNTEIQNLAERMRIRYAANTISYRMRDPSEARQLLYLFVDAFERASSADAATVLLNATKNRLTSVGLSSQELQSVVKRIENVFERKDHPIYKIRDRYKEMRERLDNAVAKP